MLAKSCCKPVLDVKVVDVGMVVGSKCAVSQTIEYQ